MCYDLSERVDEPLKNKDRLWDTITYMKHGRQIRQVVSHLTGGNIKINEKRDKNQLIRLTG